MGYRIVYGPEKKTRKKRSKGAIFAVIGLLALALLGRHLGWGAYLIPGDAAVTVAAVEDMVAQLGAGASVEEAFAAFCREIIAHGEMY